MAQAAQDGDDETPTLQHGGVDVLDLRGVAVGGGERRQARTGCPVLDQNSRPTRVSNDEPVNDG
jgi:hypothetical protein